MTGVHVYTSTFSAHVSSIQQGHFLCRVRGPKWLLHIMPSQQLAVVSSAPFSTPDLLGATGSSLPLHSDIPATTSQKLQPVLLINRHKQDLGSLALSVIESHFLGRGENSFPQICLGLCKWHFKGVLCTWSPRANGICKDASTFQGWFLFTSNSGA